MLVAVIVTYNRKELLEQNLTMIYQQDLLCDKIIVVDNCSTDGTYEYLKNKGYIDRNEFIYLNTKKNIGGAGGFYAGTKYAFELGADWIILMDDDGRPLNKRTFKILYDLSNNLQKSDLYDGKYFINSLVVSGDMLSFKMGNKYTVQEAIDASKENILMGEANPFNGTMISRKLIETIGFPNPDFFIKGDEVNYKQRAIDAGACIVTAVNSLYYHPRPETFEKKVLGIKVPFFVEAPWKEYYTARNFTYMYKQKKQYKAIIFELLFVKLLAILSLQCQKLSTIKFVIKGFVDGWMGRLGPSVKP